LVYKEVGGAEIHQAPVWEIDIDQSLTGVNWMGTTYKSVPYTEKEFNELRKEKIEEEFLRLRAEYINKKKAELNQGGAVAVENLLDDLLGGDEEEVEEVDEEQYLEGFDEDLVRRRVASRTFVEQNRAVVIPCVYVETKSRELYCFELETGLTVWVLSLDDMLTVVPYESETHLYIVDGSVCRVIDKRSGYVSERIRFDRAVHPRLFGVGRRVFAYSYDQRLLCYEWGTRFPKWLLRLGAVAPAGVFGHDNGIMAPLDNGKFVSVSFDGDIQWSFISKSHSDEKIYLEKLNQQHAKELERERAMARKEGRPEEKVFVRKHVKAMSAISKKISDLDYRSRGRYEAEPDLDGENLFVGSTDYQFYSLNRFSGLPGWSYSSGGELSSKSVHSASYVYVRSENDELHRVEKETGRGKVVMSNVSKILGAVDDLAIVLSEDMMIRTWSPQGESILDYKWGEDAWPSVSVSDKLMIGVWDDGVLRAYALSKFRGLR
jgi:outer membrane protein assembly factor BamB